jgi:lysophospholipase L1-like esterase
MMHGRLLKTVFLACFASACSAFAAELPAQPGVSKWEKDIAAFERADATNPPPKGALLFIGSSTVRMWKTLKADFPNHAVINRGFGGSQIADATEFAPRIVFPYAPKAVYLRSGGNDLWAGKTVNQVFADFQAFVAAVHAKLPETDIVYISLCPSVARWKQAEITKELNAKVAAFIQGKPHLRYVETYDMVLAPDGQPRPELFIKDLLHFNAEGYKLLAERVRADVERAYPAK